jgi:hypothetical protein
VRSLSGILAAVIKQAPIIICLIFGFRNGCVFLARAILGDLSPFHEQLQNNQGNLIVRLDFVVNETSNRVNALQAFGAHDFGQNSLSHLVDRGGD